EGTGCPLEIAAPFGDTMVQAALHCASSNGFPFSAAGTPLAVPIRTIADVKIASLIARTPILPIRWRVFDPQPLSPCASSAPCGRLMSRIIFTILPVEGEGWLVVVVVAACHDRSYCR